MALHTITDHEGDPNVFNLNRNGERLRLDANLVEPTNGWSHDNKFVFCFRKCILFRAYKSRFFFSEFFKLFFQPPSILPASPSFIATSSYCLLEIILPSQATETRNFNASKTNMLSDI